MCLRILERLKSLSNWINKGFRIWYLKKNIKENEIKIEGIFLVFVILFFDRSSSNPKSPGSVEKNEKFEIKQYSNLE